MIIENPSGLYIRLYILWKEKIFIFIFEGVKMNWWISQVNRSWESRIVCTRIVFPSRDIYLCVFFFSHTRAMCFGTKKRGCTLLSSWCMPSTPNKCLTPDSVQCPRQLSMPRRLAISAFAIPGKVDSQVRLSRAVLMITVGIVKF